MQSLTSPKDILKKTEQLMKKAIEALLRSLSEIRTGKASASLVEEMKVSCYGQVMPLKQVASVTIPDAHLILIQPWDQSIIGDIEKTISNSKLGVSPTDDGKVIRIALPPLSEERRREIDKIVKKEAEHARISLRTIRREAKESIDKLLKNKEIGEDEAFKAKEDLQKLMDRYVELVEEKLREKEKELRVI